MVFLVQYPKRCCKRSQCETFAADNPTRYQKSYKKHLRPFYMEALRWDFSFTAEVIHRRNQLTPLKYMYILTFLIDELFLLSQKNKEHKMTKRKVEITKSHCEKIDCSNNCCTY